jgi:BON domain
MGEYEDRYPDAFGRGEEVDPPPAHRHFTGVGLPRQVRDDQPAEIVTPPDTAEPAAPAPPAPMGEPAPPMSIPRTPREICDDVHEQLTNSPFIDASGIAITVDGSLVRLDGTINSLIAISLAQALVSNVPGVGRVQVQLRVR